MFFDFLRKKLISEGQIKKTLPRSAWEGILVRENGEPLVEIVGTDKVTLRPADIFPGMVTSFLVRKSVAEKIYQASITLPEGVNLVIIEGYRSMSKQTMAWERKWNIVKSEHPDWSDKKVDVEVRQVVARPVGIPNHVCGGAVDVILADSQGVLLDFGTPYATATEADRSKAPMFASGLTDLQVAHRSILRTAMESAGFVWYPGEWWHYCYGDRMWAAYTRRTECEYGLINL